MKAYQLSSEIERHFNLDELAEICHRLDIKLGNIPGATISAKARELVKFCDRHGLINELIENLKELRPQKDWHYTESDPPSAILPTSDKTPFENVWLPIILLLVFSVAGLFIVYIFIKLPNKLEIPEVSQSQPVLTLTPEESTSIPNALASVPTSSLATAIPATLPITPMITPTNFQVVVPTDESEIVSEGTIMVTLTNAPMLVTITMAETDLVSELETDRTNALETIPLNAPMVAPTDTTVPTLINTPEVVPTNILVPTPTDTPVVLPTNTPMPTPTDTPVVLPTNTPMPTPTDTPVVLPTNTPMPTPTDTPAVVPTDTPTPVATSTSFNCEGISSPSGSCDNENYFACGQEHYLAGDFSLALDDFEWEICSEGGSIDNSNLYTWFMRSYYLTIPLDQEFENALYACEKATSFAENDTQLGKAHFQCGEVYHRFEIESLEEKWCSVAFHFSKADELGQLPDNSIENLNNAISICESYNGTY